MYGKYLEKVECWTEIKGCTIVIEVNNPELLEYKSRKTKEKTVKIEVSKKQGN